MIYMDEFVGRYRLRMKGIVNEIEPGRKIVWQFKMGIRLPVWLVLEVADDAAGVTITHTIKAGFAGPGKLFDPIFRLYLSDRFAHALDAHVRAEFTKLRDLLRRSGSLSA